MALIGVHVSAAGGLWKAFDRAEALACEAMQIFTRNQLQWGAKPVSLEECERFFKRQQQSPIKKVLAHASYLINLAGSGETRKKSILALVAEVERCDHLGIEEVVLHPGSACSEDGDIDRALELLVAALEDVFESTPSCRVRILLETMAGQGMQLGAELEQLSNVTNHFGRSSRLGVCVDLCHLFASGYEIRGRESWDRLVRHLEKHFGLDGIGCWHLSDSKVDRGARVDRHEHLGEGMIGLQPFAHLMNDARFEATPTLLETPKSGYGDEGNIALLKKMRGM